MISGIQIIYHVFRPIRNKTYGPIQALEKTLLTTLSMPILPTLRKPPIYTATLQRKTLKRQGHFLTVDGLYVAHAALAKRRET